MQQAMAALIVENKHKTLASFSIIRGPTVFPEGKSVG
jgi:hypothetical protein